MSQQHSPFANTLSRVARREDFPDASTNPDLKPEDVVIVEGQRYGDKSAWSVALRR